MNDFVALDFETANAQRGSPCAVGIAEVRGGRVDRVGSLLISPPVPGFDARNVQIHGITPEMCAQGMPWPEVIRHLSSVVGDRLVVAHNASFDMSVVRDSCAITGEPLPSFRFVCTMRVGQAVWPDLGRYTLVHVAKAAGLPPFKHHDCRQDALTAAGIAIAAVDREGRASLADLVDTLGARCVPRVV